MSFLKKIQNRVSPTTIDQFKATIGKRSGLAKQNRFQIFMSPPQQSLLNIDLGNIAVSALSGNFKASSLINDPRDIGILCKSVTFPGDTIETMNYDQGGFKQNTLIPTGFAVNEVDLVWHLTNDYYIKKMFDKWIGLIIDKDTYLKNYESTYLRDITIQQLNEQNMPIYGIELQDAFPKSTNAITLSNDSKDVVELTVNFAFKNFKPAGGIASSFGGIKDALGGITSLF